MVLKLDGNTGIGTHGWRNLGYLICLSHLIRSRVVTEPWEESTSYAP